MPAEIKIRDLETGEILTRVGANAVEILRVGAGRYVQVGQEPKGWRPKKD